MDRSEVLAFLNSNPIFHLATVYKNRPYVRALYLYRADDNGIIFHTAKVKDVFRQLSVSPEVELCFNDYGRNVQIRVHGTAELVEDLALKKEIAEKRTLLQPWLESAGYESLAVFRVINSVAVVWTDETTFASKKYIEL